MRRSIAVVLCVLASRLSQAQTLTPRGAPVSVAGATAVSISNMLGYIRVEGWDKDSVAFATGPSVLFTIVRDADGEIRISVELVDKGLGHADILVRVPRNVRVNVDGNQTKIDVSGLTGRVDIDAGVSGDIKVTGTPSELNIESAQSDLDLQVTTPYLRAHTRSGRIRWTGSSDDVLLSTVINGIAIKSESVGRGRFESTSGDIHFSGGVTPRASIVFETHSGDITADFAKGTQAEVIVSGAVMDLFGQHATLQPDPAAMGSLKKQIGASHDAVVTLRSFKGRVSTTLVP
jgi:hypothetical protein